MSEMNEMSCAMLADVAAELALGVLTGRERADAIEHLDRCEACREDVRKLMATGDELLLLLPPAEPSPGFETRVLDRLGLLAPGLPAPSAPGRAVTIPIVAGRGLPARRRSSHRRSSGRRPGGAAPRARQLLAAAAVAIAVAGAGIGGWGMRVATTAPTATSASALTYASLDSASLGSVGQAFVYRNNPQWMYMSVDLDGAGNSTVTCQLIGANGNLVPMGTFRLNAAGYGWWSSPLRAAGGMPRGIQVVAANGTVLASATFTG
jgi:hypothetical protein